MLRLARHMTHTEKKARCQTDPRSVPTLTETGVTALMLAVLQLAASKIRHLVPDLSPVCQTRLLH